MSDDDVLQHWLQSVQGTHLQARQIIDPARVNQPVGDIIKSAGGGRQFDVEPANFHKLLIDLAPSDLTRD